MPRYHLNNLLLALACCATLSAPVHAAELGDVVARSYVGQPLSADVELVSLGADELASLQARLAQQDVYQGASIKMNPALSSVRMTVERRDNKPYLHVATTGAVNADYVHVYIELSAAGQRKIRLATVWLQPDPHPAAPPASTTTTLAAAAGATPAAPLAAAATAATVAAGPAASASPSDIAARQAGVLERARASFAVAPVRAAPASPASSPARAAAGRSQPSAPTPAAPAAARAAPLAAGASQDGLVSVRDIPERITEALDGARPQAATATTVATAASPAGAARKVAAAPATPAVPGQGASATPAPVSKSAALARPAAPLAPAVPASPASLARAATPASPAAAAGASARPAPVVAGKAVLSKAPPGGKLENTVVEHTPPVQLAAALAPVSAAAALPAGVKPGPASPAAGGATQACTPDANASACKALDARNLDISSKIVELEAKVRQLQGALAGTTAGVAAAQAGKAAAAAGSTAAGVAGVAGAAGAAGSAAGSAQAGAAQHGAVAEGNAAASPATAKPAAGAQGPQPLAATAASPADGKPATPPAKVADGHADAAAKPAGTAANGVAAATSPGSATSATSAATEAATEAAAAGEAAKPPAPVQQRRVLPKLKYKKEKPPEEQGSHWPLIAAGVGVAALAGAGLVLYKRRRKGGGPLKIWQGFLKKPGAAAAAEGFQEVPAPKSTPARDATPVPAPVPATATAAATAAEPA